MTENLKLRATTDIPIDDEFKKRAYYRFQAKEQEKEDIKSFKESIEKGEHDERCLSCYLSGLRYCIYWSNEGLCSDFEKKEMEQAFIDFR